MLDIIAAGLARILPAIRPPTTVAPLPASAVGSLVAGHGSADSVAGPLRLVRSAIPAGAPRVSEAILLRRCRTIFWSALRRLGARAITDDILKVSDLQKGTAEACTLATCQRSASPPADKGPADPTLLAALRRVGAVKGVVSVAPEGIVEMVRLGWLDRHSCRHPRVVGDAITDLANAALDAGLRADS